jgi:chromosomal replication initiator protein
MAAREGLSWDALLRHVQSEHPQLYRSWFESLRPGALAAGQLTVRTDDSQQVPYLQESCAQAFASAAMRLSGHLVTVRFICDDRSALPPSDRDALVLTESSLNVDYTFEQFVVGVSNRLAHAACRAVCTEPGAVYNPLFIHGPSGLGKTHLLQATCAALRHARPSARVLYVSCESFVNDFVRAIETGRLVEFHAAARGVDVLVIDDVQFLANRESSQEELFHTFNALHQDGRQIVLSADSPPGDIPTLEERLISRFSWGLVTQIDLPNRETRQAILAKKARLRGCEVPLEVLDYIAERVESNVRSLEGALTKLILECQIGGRPMSRDTARNVLGEAMPRPKRRVRVSDILDTVAQHFAVSRDDLVGERRTRSIAYPRQIGMYLARKLTPLSLQEIGEYFGKRDHSTVLHAERVITADCETNPETANTVSQLTRDLLAAS